MSKHELDWDALGKVWRKPESAPDERADFEAELARRRRAMSIVVAGELLVSAALIWYTLRVVRGDTQAAHPMLLGWLWLLWAVATTFAWWNRRGQWQRSAASTEDFVRISLERAQRKLRVVGFTVGCLLAQVLFVAIIASSSDASDGGRAAMEWIPALAGLSAVYLTWCAFYYRRARREQRHFAQLLDSVDGSRPPAGG